MPKPPKDIYYIEKVPGDILKGLGWIEIDLETARRFNIPRRYTSTVLIPNPEPHCCPINPDDKTPYFQLQHESHFRVYLPSTRGSRKKYTLHLAGETIAFTAATYLTVKAILEWLRTWADSSARLVTPKGKTFLLEGTTTSLVAFVYFVFNADSKAIKIGMAKDVGKRLKALQTSSPAPLELLKTIRVNSIEEAAKLESDLHRRFEHLRLTGEWFRVGEDLTVYLKHCPDAYDEGYSLDPPKPYRSVPISRL